MLDGTLFIVKCARYGNPDKYFIRISFLYYSPFLVTKRFRAKSKSSHFRSERK